MKMKKRLLLKSVILVALFLSLTFLVQSKEIKREVQIVKSLSQLKKSKDVKDFSFIVCSDNHMGHEGADKVFREILKQAELRGVDFVVNCGDLVEKGNFKEWKDLRRALEEFSLPFFPTVGNHDSFFTNKYYLKYMGSLYYSFDYGDCHFLILDNAQLVNNATLYLEPGQKGEQWDWLKSDLKKSRKRYKFVFMHFPMYGRRSMLDPQYIKNATWEKREREVGELNNLFIKAGVDYVFNGHIHNWTRTIRDGIVRIRCGGAGGETDPKNFHFIQVFVKKDKVIDEVVFLNGKIFELNISPKRYKFKVGETQQYIANGISKDGDLIALRPIWELKGDIGKLTPSGVFKATKKGRGKIIASSGDFKTSLKVEVK